jgi:hypothetical protein
MFHYFFMMIKVVHPHFIGRAWEVAAFAAMVELPFLAAKTQATVAAEAAQVPEDIGIIPATPT